MPNKKMETQQGALKLTIMDRQTYLHLSPLSLWIIKLEPRDKAHLRDKRRQRDRETERQRQRQRQWQRDRDRERDRESDRDSVSGRERDRVFISIWCTYRQKYIEADFGLITAALLSQYNEHYSILVKSFTIRCCSKCLLHCWCSAICDICSIFKDNLKVYAFVCLCMPVHNFLIFLLLSWLDQVLLNCG